MIINVDKLRELGVSVEIRDLDGVVRHKNNGYTIEIHPMNSEVPQALIDSVHEAVATPEYADAIVGNVIAKLQMFQLLETIERSNK